MRVRVLVVMIVVVGWCYSKCTIVLVVQLRAC